MIEVQDVTKFYGRVCALDAVSFQVPEGKIVGLLGPNGSGKTTLMRILTGFFPPTAGRVRVGGLDVSAHPLEVRRRLGYLPENVVLYPDMSVRAFLDFCAKVKIDIPSERKISVGRVIRQCSLEHMTKRLIGTLSKGYRQRVGLAQSLLGSPQVLVLDEPTVGLDPNQVIEMRELIKGLTGHTTVLLSSHILSEVSLTCDNVIIIDKGVIVAEDKPEGLSRRLQSAVQTFARISGPKTDIIHALRGLNGVSDIREQATEQAGHGLVISSDKEAIASEIVRTSVSCGWDLHELRPITMGLEELFVRLTDEAGGMTERQEIQA